MLSAFLKRLLFARQFYMINGKIEVLGVKQIMLPSDLVLDIQNINNKKIYEITKNGILENIKLLSKKLGASQEGMLKVIEELYETIGTGSLKIIDLDNKNKKGIVRIFNSPLAESSLTKNKRSKEVVCYSISGILAGMFSFLFNDNIDAQEKICLAQGKEYCEFIIKKR